MTVLPDFIEVLSTARGQDAYITGRMALHLHAMVRLRPDVIEIASSTTGLRSNRGSPERCRLVHMPTGLATGASLWTYPDGRSFLVASPEKALFDWAFDAARSRPWQRMSIKISLPAAFDGALLDDWVGLVIDARVRSCIERGLQQALAHAVNGPLPDRQPRRVLPSSAEAIDRLTRPGLPALSVADAAQLLDQPPDATRRVLARLASEGASLNVARNVWAVGTPADPVVLAPFVVREDAYISCRTALHHRGLIRRAPPHIEVVSALATSGRVYSKVGVYQVSVVPPELVGGHEDVRTSLGQTARIASPEKALFDVAYLAAQSWQGRTSVAWLTEPSFDRAEGYSWIRRIEDPALRLRVQRLWERLAGLSAHKPVTVRRPPGPPVVGSDAAAKASLDLDRVRRALIQVASVRETIPLKSLASLIVEGASDPASVGRVNRMLQTIVETEVAAGRPMLPVVVRTAGAGGPPRSVIRMANDMRWLAAGADEADSIEVETRATWDYWETQNP